MLPRFLCCRPAKQGETVNLPSVCLEESHNSTIYTPLQRGWPHTGGWRQGRPLSHLSETEDCPPTGEKHDWNWPVESWWQDKRKLHPNMSDPLLPDQHKHVYPNLFKLAKKIYAHQHRLYRVKEYSPNGEILSKKRNWLNRNTVGGKKCTSIKIFECPHPTLLPLCYTSTPNLCHTFPAFSP